MLFAAVWAPQIVHFGGLWGYLQQMFLQSSHQLFLAYGRIGNSNIDKA